LQTTAAATDSQAGNANTFMAQNDANQDIFKSMLGLPEALVSRYFDR
jgi:hypothetical protein